VYYYDKTILLQANEFESLDAPFAKKKEDVLDGDIVTIVSDAKKQPSRFNPNEMQTIIKIKTRNGDRYVALSQTSINILISEFKTNDASQWVGKEAKVLLKPTTIGGKKVIALYLTGKDWELDEYGSPEKKGAEGVQEEPIDFPEENPVNIEDIGF
jgi:hypothetical protein